MRTKRDGRPDGRCVDRRPLSDVQRELVAENIRLARWIAKPFKALRPDLFDEISSNSFLALCEAVQSYDSGRNVNFGSFARHRIRGALLDLIRSHHRKRQLQVADFDVSRVANDDSPRPGDFDDLIKSLNDRDREILALRYREGMTTYEVASRIRCSQAYVHRLEQSALVRLRERGVACSA